MLSPTVPLVTAAEIALRTVVERAEAGFEHVRQIRFVLWGERALKVHEEVLASLTG